MRRRSRTSSATVRSRLCHASCTSLTAVSAKEHLSIVFIGHVDAGKSTLGGNLLYLTGMVDKRTMEKYEREAKDAGRESWYLSWALDSTPQERAQGKTVEVGRGYFETPARRYTILDAPGHKTFVPSMISGAAQADVAILVISARKGEFETGFERGGQTREHIMLVKTAGVSKLIIVINKMDDVTVAWDEGRYNEIRDKMIPFVKAAGFNPKTDVVFMPVSAYTGANLKDVVAKGVAPWYKGTSFLDHLDKMPMVTRNLSAPLMMPISEKYKDMGTVVVGKVESGHIRKNDSLLLMPNKTLVEVAAITNELEEEVDLGLCGDNVRVRLRGVDDEDISPGFVLTSPSKPVRAVRQFEAQLAILEHKNIICAGYSAVMHIHTTAEEVTLPVRAAYRAHASCSPRPLRRHCSTTLIARRAASRASRRSSPSAGRRSSR
jgi:peptide chain release factor subunit 3